TSPSEVGSFNASGNADAYGVYAIGTTAYLVRKSSGDDELIVIDASNPASPSELGTQDLGANANEIFVMGDYAYIASDDNSEELQVADISDLESIDIVGTYNASGNSDANTITGFTDRILLGRADGLLFLLDVSTPSSPSSLGSTDVGNATLDLAMGPDNDYVFVACDTNNQEFQVIDITNPPTLQTLSFLGASNDLHGIVYDADHDRAYAVGEDNSEEFVVYMPQ
ncbi:MAG: hypothetical protein ABIH67_02820, partial [Candidatus Uhrbacteria bacterium]